jgi:hypothetical protein
MAARAARVDLSKCRARVGEHAVGKIDPRDLGLAGTYAEAPG